MISYVFTEAIAVALGLSIFVCVHAVIDFVMTLMGRI